MHAVALVVAVLALVATSCGGMDEEAVAPPSPPAETATPDAAGRPAAPPIEGETLDGERLSLEDLRGRPVFVNVWSSW